MQHRRHRQRFPLFFDLHWKILATKEEGDGQIINISSAGALFSSNVEFAIGEQLELSISWPEKVDGKFPLKLMALAMVVRCDKAGIAVSIYRYEFRLQGAPDLMRGRGH